MVCQTQLLLLVGQPRHSLLLMKLREDRYYSAGSERASQGLMTAELVGRSLNGNSSLNLDLSRRFGIIGHLDGRTPNQRLDAAGPGVVLATIEERELNAHLCRAFGDCAQRNPHGK